MKGCPSGRPKLISARSILILLFQPTYRSFHLQRRFPVICCCRKRCHRCRMSCWKCLLPRWASQFLRSLLKKLSPRQTSPWICFSSPKTIDQLSPFQMPWLPAQLMSQSLSLPKPPSCRTQIFTNTFSSMLQQPVPLWPRTSPNRRQSPCCNLACQCQRGTLSRQLGSMNLRHRRLRTLKSSSR